VLRLGHVDLTTRLSLEKLGEHERSYAGDGMFAGGKWARTTDPVESVMLSVQADPSETVVRRSVRRKGLMLHCDVGEDPARRH
jgi:hypothetical protein